MKIFSLNEITPIINGKLYGKNLYLKHLSIDTKNINSNSLFIALIGKNFDAHNFLCEAIQNGAKALIVNKKIIYNIPHIIVKDTKIALGKIASWIRSRSNVFVVGITGSSGKTSVKEMTTAILKNCGKTLCNKKNFNNDIGVPITLLDLNDNHKYAVIELGGNHLGEIKYISQITNPDSVLINNITASHLEGFGTLDKVALAKREIFFGLKKKELLLLTVIVMIGLIGKDIVMQKKYGIFL